MIKVVADAIAAAPKRNRSAIERRARRIIAEHVRKRGQEEAEAKSGTRVYHH